MKFSLIICFALSLVIIQNSFAQNPLPEKMFRLNGKIDNPKLDSVSIEYIDIEGKYIHQVIPVKKGEFTINGRISQPSFSFLLFKHQKEILSSRDIELRRNLVYLEPHDMYLTSEADKQGYIYLKGSATHAEWNALRTKVHPLEAMADSLSALNGGGHEGGNAELRTKTAPYQREINQVYYDFFISHPDSYVASDRVMYFTGKFGLDSLRAIYNKFSPPLKESMGGRRLAAALKRMEAGRVGTQAYAFNVKDREGKDLSLASFSGKYVLLDFWATWCVPCRRSMPKMIQLYQKYKAKNFDIIGIGDDDKNVTNWSAAIDHDGIGMFHHTLRGIDMEMTRQGLANPRDLDEQYGVQALPAKFLIDPEGKIIGRFDGKDTDDTELDKMLTAVLD